MRGALLRWHKIHGRHGLSWRLKYDPYAVLVSEFMLQQTTVAAVEPRFQSWMKVFPSISDLAAATEEEVLTAWHGLGYYARARRLHQAARDIVDQHAGLIPKDRDKLLSLPGVGVYTAEAVLAFAFDKPAVVLDTNISRVLCRLFNLTTPIDTVSGKEILTKTAASFFPQKGCRSITSALMDLGATLCSSGIPRCSVCPLEKSCTACHPEKLPKKTRRPNITKLTEFRAWYSDGKSLFLQRSQGPRWQNLWVLPEILPETIVKNSFGRALIEVTYPITRYRITMKVFQLTSKPPSGLHSFNLGAVASLPIPSPHRKAIQTIRRAIAARGIPSHNSD